MYAFRGACFAPSEIHFREMVRFPGYVNDFCLQGLSVFVTLAHMEWSGTNIMINCTQCKHYYITWDKDFPHGCRAMGFKSARPPSVAVRMSADQECAFFTKKIRETKGKTNA